MRNPTKFSRIVPAVLAMASVAGLTACAHVKRDEMNTRLEEVKAELRSDQQAGDDQVAQELGDRIGAVDSRVDGLEARVDENAARLDALERALADLEEEFSVTVERMEGMIAFNMPVHFEFDSATLRDSDRPVLDRFAQVYNEYYSGSTITVEGFTDPAGSEEYNIQLGKRRAEGVKSYLTEVAGLTSTSEIRTVSYGEAQDRLVAPGEWGAQGMENRRVTVVVDYAGQINGLSMDTTDGAGQAPATPAAGGPGGGGGQS